NNNNNDCFNVGFYRASVMKLLPKFELTVTVDGVPKTQTFDYRTSDRDVNLYLEERFQKNFMFEMPGNAPGGDEGRAVTMNLINRLTLWTAEDAKIEAWTGSALTVPPSAELYASGFK